MNNQSNTALVTGAGRGIGRAIALALAQEGYAVGLCARTVSELESVRGAIEALGGHAIVLPCDVIHEKEVHTAVDSMLHSFGTLDVLVNNAGHACFKPVWELTLDEWKYSMDVNVTSAFMFCQAVIPHMMQRRFGRIINISSITRLKALPEQGAYCAAKHALNGWTKSLAYELRPYNIAVHALCPGGVDTRLSQEAMPHRDKTDWMTPEDIADAVKYLCSLSPRVAIDILTLRRFTAEPGV